MALYKIADFDPSYSKNDHQEDIRGFDLYSRDEKAGSVEDLLVDDAGRFRYFVINTGLWIFGKKVLLPIGCAQIDYSNHRIYANSLNKEQVEALPEFSNDMTVDLDYEERVGRIYRPSPVTPPAAYGTGYAGYDSAPPVASDAPVAHGEGYAGYDSAPPAPSEVTASSGVGRAGYESAPTVPVNAPPSHGVGYEGYESAPAAPPAQIALDRDSEFDSNSDFYSNQENISLYETNERDHQYLKRYEERLIAARRGSRK
ncbi:PRC-barrel domain-containing protein [Kovacikia minuta CCNUW1]|uniref:PRC-barrel domain-containing protein n=1 Tax=Kovacikia minuta TaxID=2931930 RepID=UPI001CC9FE6F|nr:PRC-barrel domain-containing protein [Kovacikia minuta]UBF23601.1 PRC-barrel domain-containing protein [Kovacikia minuta CCNUW1]